MPGTPDFIVEAFGLPVIILKAQPYILLFYSLDCFRKKELKSSVPFLFQQNNEQKTLKNCRNSLEARLSIIYYTFHFSSFHQAIPENDKLKELKLQN